MNDSGELQVDVDVNAYEVFEDEENIENTEQLEDAQSRSSPEDFEPN